MTFFSFFIDYNNSNQFLTWKGKGKAYFDYKTRGKGHLFAHCEQIDVLCNFLQ